MIEQMISLERLHRPASQFYFFRTHAGAEIDLMIDRGTERVGVEIKAGASVDRDDWVHLAGGVSNGLIARGIVVYNGTRAFPLSDAIRALPAADALARADW